MRKYSVTTARSNFREVLEEAKSGAVELNKDGMPVAVILDAMKYERLLSYVENLEDSDAILEYELNPKSFGKTTPLQEVERGLNLKTL